MDEIMGRGSLPPPLPLVNRSTDGTMGVLGKVTVAATLLLFIVVVFLLFLHLYIRRFWWPRFSRPAAFVFAPAQEEAAAARRRGAGLDAAVLCSLPVFIFDPSTEGFKEGLECAVCLCELSQGEKARLLPKCNHGFHAACIDMWFHSHSTCPLCRNPVADSCHPESQSLDHQTLDIGPNFPTNVLFWGDHTRIISTTASTSPVELPPLQSPPPPPPPPPVPSTSSAPSSLSIDIPPNWQMAEISTISSSESRSPLTTRLRSLKRLLSRDTRSSSIPSSPTTVAGASEQQATPTPQMSSSKPTPQC